MARPARVAQKVVQYLYAGAIPSYVDEEAMLTSLAEDLTPRIRELQQWGKQVLDLSTSYGILFPLCPNDIKMEMDVEFQSCTRFSTFTGEPLI